jgi:hypothetical protein
MTRTTVQILGAATLLLASCGSSGSGGDPPGGDIGAADTGDAQPDGPVDGPVDGSGSDVADASRDVAEFLPAPPPELETLGDGTDQPIYLFLFTHTEDPFNHDLSEARYTRIGPMVEAVDEAHPEAHLTWTIEFQGADAAVVAERNETTRVVNRLRDLAGQGLVEFGYHAHHDPTYLNRPQRELGPDSSWEEWVEGMNDWVSCEKDLLRGGCIETTGGGLLAIEDHFGPVQIVTGIYTYSEAAIEGGAGRHAVARYLPERLLGFGFPDHGSTATEDFVPTLRELMTLMTPSIHTSATLLWVDDVIKINDGNVLDGVQNVRLHEGIRQARSGLEGLDRSRPHIVNTMIGSKYIYTQTGTSPTRWGYAHWEPEPGYPDNPQLPPEHINRLDLIEANYATTEATLEFLAGELREEEPAVRFVRAQEIVDMVATADYWEVTDAELDVIARWLLHHWSEAPPAFASDGDLFYSLRDCFLLFTHALSADSLPASQQLGRAYGPLSQTPAPGAVEISAEAIRQLAAELAPSLVESESWSVTPSNILQPSYESSAGPIINTAQLLYGMAMVYASSYAGRPVRAVTIPAADPMPETLALLLRMNCPEGACEGTSWSLKPARIEPLGE